MYRPMPGPATDRNLQDSRPQSSIAHVLAHYTPGKSLLLLAAMLCLMAAVGCTSMLPGDVQPWIESVREGPRNAPSASEQAETRATERAWTDTFGSDAPEMLAFINEARSEPRMCGDEAFDAAPPLIWNADLVEAARVHNEDMTTNVFRGHEGSDGSTPMQRVSDQVPRRFVSVGETISYFTHSDERAVERWLDSPGHCRVIMNPAFTHMGADAAVGPRFNAPDREGNYRTAVYGRMADRMLIATADRDALKDKTIMIYGPERCLNTIQLRASLERGGIPYYYGNTNEDESRRAMRQDQREQVRRTRSVRAATPTVIIDDVGIDGPRNASELADAWRSARR